MAAASTCFQQSRRQYYSDRIDTVPSSSRNQLFSVTSELLGKRKTKLVPSDIPPKEQPQKFCTFFADKIDKIRSELDSQYSDPPSFAVYEGPIFDKFEPVSVSDVQKLITEAPTKSCTLDPIPTSLTKQCLDTLGPLITSIINASLSTGVFPKQFKEAVVTPILKKSGLNCNELKNYRPVSNLPFLSKVLEKIVLAQLKIHLSRNSLLEECQSAYRKNHSVETAVLGVMNGLLLKADQRLVSLMAFLDLSAAFDTLDHCILLKRLDVTFGIRGVVLDWFTSYISNRHFSVVVNGVLSDCLPLRYGVPQGSVLGPVLFTLYSQPLSDVIIAHSCDFHKYADDTEVSQSGTPGDFPPIQTSIETCVNNVLGWMNSNKLKLNTDKTEVLPVGSPGRLELIDSESADIGGSVVPFKSSVKYLGVTIDQTLSMHDHISNICRSCFLELRRIASIRSFLSISSCNRLVTAFILSRLDFCNSVLFGLPKEEICRLQRIQNSAARLTLQKRKQDHVTPLLRELHWLPVQFRLEYKLAVLTFRHFEETLPSYLANALHTYTPSRSLRSSYAKQLKVPKVNLKSCGQRSFSFCGPTVWNALPDHLRHQSTLSAFKSHLKTHLFQKAFLL